MPVNRPPPSPPAALIDDLSEVRELTAKDFRQFRPTGDFPELVNLLVRHGKMGRPPLPEGARKQRVTLHLDPDVLDRLKAGGRGWQTRANAALRKALGLE